MGDKPHDVTIGFRGGKIPAVPNALSREET